MGFQLNLPSFGIGFGAGVLTSVVLYRAYREWDKWRKTSLQTVSGERVFVSRRGDRRYTAELIRACQQGHLFGKSVPLRDILIEPRFIPMPSLPNPPDDPTPRDPFEVVPIVPDFPQLHAQYQLPTLSIDDLGKGEQAIVILGMLGSGRTTALQAIALWSMGQISFEAPPDKVAQQLAEAEKELSSEEQRERIKRRTMQAQQAREQFNLSRGKGKQTDSEDDSNLSPLRRLAPLYVHLANVQLQSGEFGARIDPAEPLVRALQSQVKRLTARIMPRTLYRLVSEGRALILIDGYDELPDAERPEKLAWLSQLMRTYAQNFFIITAAPVGFQPFVALNCVPLYLQGFAPNQRHASLQKWRAAWQSVAKDMPFNELGAVQAEHEGRAQHALEFTLNLWMQAQAQTGTYSQRTDAYWRWCLPNYDKHQAQLIRLAVYQLEHHYITRRSFIDAEMALLHPPSASPNLADANATTPSSAQAQEAPEQNAPEALIVEASETTGLAPDAVPFPSEDQATSEPSATPVEPAEAPAALSKQVEQARRQQIRQLSQFFNDLVKQGVLVRYRGGRYQFRHAYLAAHLAAYSLRSASPALLRQRWSQPIWHTALSLAAEHHPLDELVADILLSPVSARLMPHLGLLEWLKYAGQDATWRANLLRYFANLLVAPHQYSRLRERISAVLLASADSGVLVIFRKALSHQSAHLRRLAALALGVLADLEAISPLIELALSDPDEVVQVAASIALGAMANQDGLVAMVEVLQRSENREVQRAIAETLAAYPEEGYPTLYDAIQSPDMMMRRAAVWGLGRISNDWALITLNHIYLDDSEWYVKSAAETIFADLYEIGRQGARHPEALSEIKWLNEWIDREAYRGAIASDLSDDERLLAAMSAKDETSIRQLSIAVAGILGKVHSTGVLYRALMDREERVRDAAQNALCELDARLNVQLTLPL